MRRRLPRRFGRTTLFVSPENGGLRYWRRDLSCFDPALLAFVDLFVASGATVWDVGANVGLFGFAASVRAGAEGTVLLIEPDIENASLLLRSWRALPRPLASRMHILPAAVGPATPMIVEFAIAERNRATNALVGHGSTQMGGVREIRRVPTYSLDALLNYFPEPHVVKIDVEGAEAGVLSGAQRVLHAIRPVVHVEVTANASESVRQMFVDASYRMFDGTRADGWRPEVSHPPQNCIAVPVECCERFASVLGGLPPVLPGYFA